MPSRRRSSAGWMVSNEISLVLAGSIARGRVAGEHRPAAGREPGGEIGIPVRAGRDELGAADRVFLQVVDLDNLDPGGLGERFLHAVEPALQVAGAHAGDDRDLALAVQQLHGLLAEDLPAGEVVDAVERHPLRLGRVRVPGHDRDARVDRLVDRFGQEVAVQRRDRDAVDLLGDRRLENLFLLQLVGASPARSRGCRRSRIPSPAARRRSSRS